MELSWMTSVQPSPIDQPVNVITNVNSRTRFLKILRCYVVIYDNSYLEPDYIPGET